VLNGKVEAIKRSCGQTRKEPLYSRIHAFSRNRVAFCNSTLSRTLLALPSHPRLESIKIDVNDRRDVEGDQL
jgi:hypothetical protein